MKALPRGRRLAALPGDGATLGDYVFEHEADRPPIVILIHRLSATITGMLADRYAEVL